MPIVVRDGIECLLQSHPHLSRNNPRRCGPVDIRPPRQAVPFEERFLKLRKLAYRPIMRSGGRDDVADETVEALPEEISDFRLVAFRPAVEDTVQLLDKALEETGATKLRGGGRSDRVCERRNGRATQLRHAFHCPDVRTDLRPFGIDGT